MKNDKEVLLAKSSQYKVRGVTFEVTPYFYATGEDMRSKIERLLKADIANNDLSLDTIDVSQGGTVK